jgi:hypothetical protein
MIHLLTRLLHPPDREATHVAVADLATPPEGVPVNEAEHQARLAEATAAREASERAVTDARGKSETLRELTAQIKSHRTRNRFAERMEESFRRGRDDARD